LVDRLPPGEIGRWSLGRLLREVPATDAARATVTARFQGTCVFDLDRVALRTALLDDMLAGGGAGPSVRIDGGNDRLPAAMAATLPEIEFGIRIEAVEHGPGGVEAVAASGRFTADAAVVAVPAPIAAGLLFDPGLPGPLEEALRELPVGAAAKLAVATTAPVAPLAVQSSDAPFWCWTALGEGGVPRSCLTSFAGSADALTWLGLGEGDPARWLDALAELVPEAELAGSPLVANWTDDPDSLGAYSAWDAPSLDRAQLLREPAGRIAFAGEHTAPDGFHGTMEGALRSGRRAAAQVLRILESRQ
jgi:monoamine oxidase